MDLCVGIDTGLVHLAASFGVPAVVLVGPTDPNQWAPWGTRHEVVRGKRIQRPIIDRLRAWRHGVRPDTLRWHLGRASMADIRLDDVLPRVATLLPAVCGAPGGRIRTLDLHSGNFRYELATTLVEHALPTPAAFDVWWPWTIRWWPCTMIRCGRSTPI